MLNLDQFISRLQQTKAEMQRTRGRDAVKMGQDVAALVQDRVQEEGETADGGSFGVYSDSYQMYREERGLTEPPYPQINFTKEGDMWRNVGVQLVRDTNGQAVVLIAPRDQIEKQKMEWNEERFGTILEMSDDEEQLLRQTVLDRYVQIFRKTGLL